MVQYTDTERLVSERTLSREGTRQGVWRVVTWPSNQPDWLVLSHICRTRYLYRVCCVRPVKV